MKMVRLWPMLLAAGIGISLAACGSGDRQSYELGCEKLEGGEYAEALDAFQDSVNQDVEVAQSQRGMGIAHLKLGNYGMAITLFEEALENEDGKKFQKDVLSYKAAAEYSNNQMEEALSTCEQIKESGADASCYYLSGKTCLALDQYDAAKSNFDAAVEKDTSYDMFLDIYQAYEEQDMDADGKEYLSRALQLNPGDGEDYYQRGRIYYIMEDYAKAQEELVQSAEAGYGDARLFLGKLYLEQSDPASARAMYQEYSQEGGNPGQAYNGLALCDMAEGNYDAALENIAAGLQAAGEDAAQNLKYNEVMVYEYKRDFATAREKMDEYLSLYPNDEDAQREAGFLQNR